MRLSVLYTPVVGTSANHPIEITDYDTDATDIDVAGPGGADAGDPIVISDDEVGEDLPVHDTENDIPAEDGVADEDSFTNSDEDDEEIPEILAYRWPPRTRYWSHNKNTASVQFRKMDLGHCRCTRGCFAHSCDNAKSAIYCDDTHCSTGSACENRLRNLESLVLVPCITGLGVMTTGEIQRGTVIGEYCGKVVPADELTPRRIDGGFVLEFRSTSVKGEPVYIDAKPGGSLCRFVNHSCSPNSAFEERAQGTTRKMVVVAQQDILAGDEITVKYSEDVPFFCLCGEAACRSTRR